LDEPEQPLDGGRGRWVRLDPMSGERVPFTIDGIPARGRAGQMLIAAILAVRPDLGCLPPDRRSRAGFCLIGLCQDCWVRLEDGRRVRACTTPLEPGMAVRLDSSDESW
jgi:predicted molibdopterin-dependent oxidoreductase YjgC